MIPQKVTLTRSVFLIGAMGSGKSTLGEMLANHLDVPFADLDSNIVQQAGKSIPRIFEEQGECIFRALEGEALHALSSDDTIKVVATGGGAVVRISNRKRIRQAGHVIWLYAAPNLLAERISGDVNRPLLKGVDALTRSKALAREREPVYERMADCRVDTGILSCEAALDAIFTYLLGFKS
ncbi:MAG: shikimate kinase [Mariprofundaceae bacterium]